LLRKPQGLIFAVAFLAVVFAIESRAQSPGAPNPADDDEWIWFEIDMQGRLDLDPAYSDYRGGKVSFRASGLLEPVE